MRAKIEKPLTPQMVAVIERMRRTQSVAVVRIHSQWWIAENDLPVTTMIPVTQAMEDAVPRSERDKLHFDKPVFWTRTIAALVARGELKFAGPKIKDHGWPYERPPYRRAVFRY